MNRRWPAIGAVVSSCVVVLAVLRVAGLRRVVVEGTSMLPTLEPGDRLIVTRARRVHPGDLVAVPDPRGDGRLLVKRVVSVHGQLVELRGDNRQRSTDSRSFGPVPLDSVRGRILRRYAPAGRRGPVG